MYVKKFIIYFHIAPNFPNPANDITIAVTSTTAMIIFHISAIAYTREQYYIEYYAPQFTTAVSSTENSALSSGDDITVTDQEYGIQLTELEEGVVYAFEVVSSNCHGSVSSPSITFTTLPTRMFACMI